MELVQEAERRRIRKSKDDVLHRVMYPKMREMKKTGIVVPETEHGPAWQISSQIERTNARTLLVISVS